MRTRGYTCDQTPQTGACDLQHRSGMSTAEKWLLRAVALSLFALWAVIAIGHIPRGG